MLGIFKRSTLTVCQRSLPNGQSDRELSVVEKPARRLNFSRMESFWRISSISKVIARKGE